MSKLPTLRSMVAATALVLILSTTAAPLALAKTASGAVSSIEDAESEVEDIRTQYNTVGELDSSSEISAYFSDLADPVDTVLSEVKTVTIPLSQSNYDDVEDAYRAFKSEISKAIRNVTTVNTSLTSNTSLYDDFKDERDDLDTEMDKIQTALDTLATKVTGATTPTGTTSASVVSSVISNIEDATSNIEDLREEADAVDLSTTELDSLVENFVDEADDVISQLKKITGTITSAMLEDIDSVVSDFTDEIDDTFVRAGSGSTSGTTFHTNFTAAKRDFRDDQKDDIEKQMERITTLALGTGISGTAIINSIISQFEDLEDDVKDVRTANDSVPLTTITLLIEYMEDLIDQVNDGESKLKRVTGTVSQASFDDLSDAVSAFEKEAKRARDSVEDGNTSTSYGDEFDDQDDDFKAALTDMNDELDRIEALVGTVNTLPGGTGNTSFYDVLSTSEFFPYITALASRGVINGYSDRSFRPKINVTRAEFLKMAIAARARDITPYQSSPSPFSDVVSSHPLRPYINYAVANGIITGQTVNGIRLYYPERPISRAEAVIILMRITGIAPGTATTSRFTDVREPEQIRYIEVASQQNVIRGYNATTFGPNDSLTREQAAKIVALINGITN
jgi:predicted  nucleic acid-binding Zn-ribbon protein